MGVGGVLNYTGESFQKLMELAECIVSTYGPAGKKHVLYSKNIFHCKLKDQKTIKKIRLSEEVSEMEVRRAESKYAVVLMKLLGIPRITRYQIYREAVGELETISDLSYGTYEFLGSIISWVRKEFKST